MDTSLAQATQSAFTPSVQDILRVWHDDRSIRASSAQQYLQCIGRFRCYCIALGLNEGTELTRDGVKRFHTWYTQEHRINSDRLGLASSSIRSLRRVHEAMGMPVPLWQAIEQPRASATVVLRDFAAHLEQYRGNPESTVRKKLDHIGKLSAYLNRFGKSWRQLSLLLIDAFLIECAGRYARSTASSDGMTLELRARQLPDESVVMR